MKINPVLLNLMERNDKLTFCKGTLEITGTHYGYRVTPYSEGAIIKTPEKACLLANKYNYTCTITREINDTYRVCPVAWFFFKEDAIEYGKREHKGRFVITDQTNEKQEVYI